MAYNRTNWQDSPSTSTPINATRLNNVEQGLVDAHNFSVICTSSTRPASPFVGQQIYETDTRRSWTYITAAWVPDDGIYATAAARDAAIPAPFVGQRAFISGTNVNTQYNGTAWVGPNTLQIPPMCIQVRTGQVIVDSVGTAIAFSSAASLDTNSMSSTTVNNTRTTATTAGVYSVSASIDVTAGGIIDVAANVYLRANGSTTFSLTSIVSNGYVQQASVCGIVNLAAAGYVELLVYQDNGANSSRTVTGYLQMAYLGRAS